MLTDYYYQLQTASCRLDLTRFMLNWAVSGIFLMEKGCTGAHKDVTVTWIVKEWVRFMLKLVDLDMIKNV